MPFDIQGRELIIYKNENDLKIQLGRSISNCLFKTQPVNVSWSSDYARSAMISSRELHFEIPHIDPNIGRKFWSNKAIHSNFHLSYKVKVLKINPNKTYPDIRFLMSQNPGGKPMIVMIFPWESMDIEPKNKFECHIDFFEDYRPRLEGHRFQQK